MLGAKRHSSVLAASGLLASRSNSNPLIGIAIADRPIADAVRRYGSTWDSASTTLACNLAPLAARLFVWIFASL
jgi:hypothetical protein